MSDSPICSGLGCRIQVTPAVLWPDGVEKIGTRVVHWSEPTWYVYINPVLIGEHGVIDPSELQRLSQMADDMHRSAP